MVRTSAAIAIFVLSMNSVVAQDFCSVEVPGQIFCDDFSDVGADPTDPSRMPVTWTPREADLSIDDSGLLVTGTGFSAARVNESLLDVSLRAQVRISSNVALLTVRSTEEGESLYFAELSTTGTAIISNSGGSLVSKIRTGFDPSQEDLMMQLDAIGSDISLYVWRPDEVFPSNAPLLQVTDTSVNDPGAVAVGTLGPGIANSASFRFVQVATQSIPEPSTAVLSCLGFLSLLAWRRKR